MDVIATKLTAIAQTVADALKLRIAVAETGAVGVTTSDRGALSIAIQKAPAS